MDNVASYLNTLFGCDVCKKMSLPIADLFNPRIDGFEKKAVFDILSNMFAFHVDGNTLVYDLLRKDMNNVQDSRDCSRCFQISR